MSGTPPVPEARPSSPGRPRDLVALLRGQRARYGVAIGCLAFASALNFLAPIVGSLAIDRALAGKPPAEGTPYAWLLPILGDPSGAASTQLWRAAFAMVALTAVGGVFTYLKGRFVAQAADGIARGLKDRLLAHLQALPTRTLGRLDTGDTVQRCTSDVETVRVALASQVVDISQAVILLVLAVPLMLALDPVMTAASLVVVPVVCAWGFFFMRKVRQLFQRVDEAEGRLTTVIQENLTGIRVVRAFGRRSHEMERFASPNRDYRERQIELLRALAVYWSVSDLMVLAQSGFVLVLGAQRVGAGDLTVGKLFAFLALLNLMLWPVRQLGRILTETGKALVAVGRIREILGETEETQLGEGRDPSPGAGPVLGAIEVRDLVFRHGGGVAAVDGVSFVARPGETVAFLGPSGAGKSTLMHLLLRLHDPESGRILLDGRDLAQADRRWVRRQFGVVMQDPFLFSKTLRDNIRLGRADAGDAEVEAAARAAAIHDTITGFPQGYATRLGERGMTLSGGQRQRVAIARALLLDPPVLILDDALSAVDGETEACILEALKSRHGRKTTLLIAHRLSSLVHADRIIVMEGGRVTQVGTHGELSVAEGLYRRLWAIQSSIEADFAVESAVPPGEGSR